MYNKMWITYEHLYLKRIEKNYLQGNVKKIYEKMRITSILKFLKRKSCIYYNTKSISTYIYVIWNNSTKVYKTKL